MPGSQPTLTFNTTSFIKPLYLEQADKAFVFLQSFITKAEVSSRGSHGYGFAESYQRLSLFLKSRKNLVELGD